MDEDLERRLVEADRFDDAEGVDVVAVAVNDFGEGEYVARFAYPVDYAATAEDDFLLELKRDLEDVLPAAWVSAFRISSDLEERNDVTVTFDYRPGDGSSRPPSSR